MMVDMLVRFETCPVVAFMGNIAVPKEFPTSRLFKLGHEKECATHLKKKIADTKVTINKVFTTFDKDASGTIEKNELK